MKKIKIYCDWGLDIDLYHEKQVELYVDSIPKDKVPNGFVRFVFLLEPPEIAQLLYGKLNENIHLYTENFNYLFTHNQDLLDKINHSYVMPLGSTWIKNYQFPNKNFEVSTLVGGKKMADGHLLRHKLWASENEITIPKRFFLSGNHNHGIQNYNNNTVLGNDKTPLFDSQFHICIENTKRKNWFTEKLIDCLQTKTVPIYYGCPNIGEWFDERGFIFINNIEEIIKICNDLTPEVYDKMKNYIEYNFEESKKYVNIADRLKDKILELIKICQ